MSGMCSVAKLLYPSIPLRGASYEDIAVSLVKALQTGTDLPSTWSRPGGFRCRPKKWLGCARVYVCVDVEWEWKWCGKYDELERTCGKLRS